MINIDTYKELILDSGAVYVNFVDFSNLGDLLCNTRGGNKFTLKPKYVDLPFEGVAWPVVGSRHVVSYEVKLEVNIINFPLFSLPKLIPNIEDVALNSNYQNISITDWDAFNAHFVNNICILGNINGTSDPLAIIIDNPFNDNGFDLSFKDKSEVTSKLVFKGYSIEDSGFVNAPFRFYWPNNYTTTPIVENAPSSRSLVSGGSVQIISSR